MKRLTIVILSVCVAVLSLSAVPLSVSWTDGNVDVQKGSSWLAVNLGTR